MYSDRESVSSIPLIHQAEITMYERVDGDDGVRIFAIGLGFLENV
jgi:hypothetical protein